MNTEDRGTSRPGFLSRLWRALSTPSARWSVLALVLLGLAVGAGATIGTQVMVAATGTDEFCGGACHSHQWIAKEHQASAHGVNRTGIVASCSDCHVPHQYPQVLFYKAKKGVTDIIAEASGVISTEEKFNKERLRMAKIVWAEYKENNSANCQTCHNFSAAVVAKQKPYVAPMHQQVLDGSATCIDCHKGVGHVAPDE